MKKRSIISTLEAAHIQEQLNAVRHERASISSNINKSYGSFTKVKVGGSGLPKLWK